MNPPDTPQRLAAEALRTRRRWLSVLFWLAAGGMVMTGGLILFQVWQLSGFDNAFPLAAAVWLGIGLSLSGVVLLLRALLSWRRAEAAFDAEAAALTARREPLPCQVEIPECQKRQAKNPLPLMILHQHAGDFTESRREVAALDSFSILPRAGGEGLFWPDAGDLRLALLGRKLLVTRTVTAESLRMQLVRSTGFIKLAVMIGSLLVTGLMMGFTGLETLELQERLQNAQASQHWPGASGVVLASETRATTVTRGKRQVAAYRAFILYSYAVNGKSFEGQRLHFAYEADEQKQLSDDIVRRFPAGSAVTVYHHPRQPRLSVLEPGHAETLQKRVDDRTILLFLIPSLLLVVGGMLTLILPLAMAALESRCQDAFLKIAPKR